MKSKIKIIAIPILLFIILLVSFIITFTNNPIVTFDGDESEANEIVTRDSVLSFKDKHTIHIHVRKPDKNDEIIVDFDSFIPLFSKSICFSKHDAPAPVPNIYR